MVHCMLSYCSSCSTKNQSICWVHDAHGFGDWPAQLLTVCWCKNIMGWKEKNNTMPWKALQHRIVIGFSVEESCTTTECEFSLFSVRGVPVWFWCPACTSIGESEFVSVTVKSQIEAGSCHHDMAAADQPAFPGPSSYYFHHIALYFLFPNTHATLQSDVTTWDWQLGGIWAL